MRYACPDLAQLTVLGFTTGVSVSADLRLGGFATHARNDPGRSWLLAKLTDGVDYLWDCADEHGIADRLFEVTGSDFGHTSFAAAYERTPQKPITALACNARVVAAWRASSSRWAVPDTQESRPTGRQPAIEV